MGKVQTGGKTNVGLYGYQKGVQTFSLDTTGVATLGASGSAQLQFDGTSGQIQNAGYAGGRGMKLDFDGEKTGASIHIRNNGTSQSGELAKGAYDNTKQYYPTRNCEGDDYLSVVPINNENFSTVLGKKDLYAKGMQLATGAYNPNEKYYKYDSATKKYVLANQPLTEADFKTQTYYIATTLTAQSIKRVLNIIMMKR